MGTHIGNEGSVFLGVNQVGEVVGWTLRQSMAIADDSQLTDAWDTHLPGSKNWSAEVTCRFDETDTNGQLALTLGASVTLNLYLEGNTTGDRYWTGTATVTGISTGQARNQVMDITFSLVGNGALSFSTA